MASIYTCWLVQIFTWPKSVTLAGRGWTLTKCFLLTTTVIFLISLCDSMLVHFTHDSQRALGPLASRHAWHTSEGLWLSRERSLSCETSLLPKWLHRNIQMCLLGSQHLNLLLVIYLLLAFSWCSTWQAQNHCVRNCIFAAFGMFLFQSAYNLCRHHRTTWNFLALVVEVLAQCSYCRLPHGCSHPVNVCGAESIPLWPARWHRDCCHGTVNTLDAPRVSSKTQYW